MGKAKPQPSHDDFLLIQQGYFGNNAEWHSTLVE